MRRLDLALSCAVAFFSAFPSAWPQCASFDHHQRPPTILSRPINDPPYADFRWGTDPDTDADHQWWNLTMVENLPGGPPLVVNWKKGGIFLAVGNPLPAGQRHCHGPDYLGQKMPELDPSAPLLYYDNRHRVNAAIYANGTGQNLPSGARELQQQASSSAAQKSKNVSALVRIETSYNDKKLGLRHVAVAIQSQGAGGVFSLRLSKPADMLVGISALAGHLSTEQFRAIRDQGERQKLAVERATLAKFAGPEAIKQLFWSVTDAAPKGELLFFEGGLENEPGSFEYKAPASLVPQRHDALAVILDRNRRPISADTITLVVP